MDFLPYSQEYMLIVSVMGGMLLGFVWDIYRLIRHYAKLGVFGTAAGDVAYWIISVYFSIQVIYDISYGNVRMFILIGFLSGAILYFYGISKYILKIFIFIIDSVLFLFKKFLSFMIYPIKFLFGKLEAILYPFKIKIKKGKDKVKRRYKFYIFKLKKVSKNKKMIYNSKKRKRKNIGRKNALKGAKSNERKSKNNRAEKKSKQ